MPIEVGDSAPGFSAEDIQGGGTIALSDYAGQTVVLTFSGLTWCGFCKQEAPVLQGLWEEYSASCEGSVQFIIISYGDVEGSSAALESAIVEYGLTMPVLVDNGIFASYGYSGVPVTYAIGPDGVVYNKALGFHTATQLRDIIEIPAIIERIRPLHVKRGESFAMTITGENLQWATALRFSGPPLKVTSLRATEHEVTAEVSAGPPSSSGTFAIYLDTVFGPADVGGRKLVIEPAPLVGADTQNTTLEPVDIRRRRHE
ncbi:MAG: TlpA family protein disulfide reductase [Myxococcales bacterium]|nr:TlpA family protein disulfide reductase [Myxococcales bacterium]